MKNQMFSFFKAIYKKMPINYKVKNKLKGMFFRFFGVFFKNTTSYRIWNSMNVKSVRHDLLKINKAEFDKYECNKKIAVQMHMYYMDLLDEFITYLNYIPFEFDALVSIMDTKACDYVKTKLQSVKNIKGIDIRTVINRGRDVAPLVSSFGNKILEYDFICHIHTKKSVYSGSEQSEWRKYLLQGLMGDRDIVKSHIYQLDKGERIGLIYPETYMQMPYWGHTWLQNVVSRDELLNRIGIPYNNNEIYIDYPVGTMFWADVKAIRQIFEAEIKTDEFPKEAGQKDGTLAHAFERCLGVICKHNDYNVLIFDEKEQAYAYNYGSKNLNQYMTKSYEQLKEEMREYDNISFDIFDTLLSRKISHHHNILRLAELRINRKYFINSEFILVRRQAEKLYRSKHPDVDCDIDDIYAELAKLTKWDAEILDFAKKTELAIEYQIVRQKKEVVEIMDYAKNVLHKKVYLISDMQLRMEDIKKMLRDNDITNYDEILLSSDMNLRKDSGEMWKYFYDKKGTSLLHIGDNEVSDVQKAEEYGVSNYHIMSNKALFQLTNVGKSIGTVNEDKPSNSVEFGLLLDSLFREPFMYNKDELRIKVSDAYQFGYNFIAPAVLNYILWIIAEADKNKAKKVLFLAREGYLFKKVYDILTRGYAEKVESEYLYVSRRALSFACIEDDKDIEKILEINYEGSLSNLLKERFGILLDRDLDIKLPDNKGRVLKAIEEYREEIIAKAEKDRKNYLAYLEGAINVKPEEAVIVSDIGYSGTIQYYLSRLSKRSYDGRYMATDEKKKPLAIEGNTIVGYYIDGDGEQQISKSYIHRYHLVIESILIAPTGQFLKIEDDGKPVFDSENNPLFNDTVEAIQSGICSFVEEYAKIMGDVKFDELPDKEFAEALIKSVIEEDIADERICRELIMDDKFCGGEYLNPIEYYKKGRIDD